MFGHIILLCKQFYIDRHPDREKQQRLYHYIIVRSDLPHGVQVAQTIHAAGESSPGGIPEGTYAIALAVPGEVMLRTVADSLKRAGIEFNLIVEPDKPWCGQAMAIGLVPTSNREKVKRILGGLPLVGK